MTERKYRSTQLEFRDLVFSELNGYAELNPPKTSDVRGKRTRTGAKAKAIRDSYATYEDDDALSNFWMK
jgi:hypothetical protein